MNLVIEYLRENEIFRKTVFAYSYEAQIESLKQKCCRKSRDTVPLTQLRIYFKITSRHMLWNLNFFLKIPSPRLLRNTGQSPILCYENTPQGHRVRPYFEKYCSGESYTLLWKYCTESDTQHTEQNVTAPLWKTLFKYDVVKTDNAAKRFLNRTSWKKRHLTTKSIFHFSVLFVLSTRVSYF